MQYRICRPTIFAFAVECNRRNIINDTFQGLDPKNIEPQKYPVYGIHPFLLRLCQNLVVLTSYIG